MSKDTGKPVDDSSIHDFVELANGTKFLRTDITRSALFHDVNLDDIMIQLVNCDIRNVDTGDTVLDAGEINHQVFLLLTGVLSVLITEADGDPITVNLYPGQSVGEISVIDGHPASAHVVASEPSSLLMIDGPTFWSFAAASTQFSRNVMAILAFRIRNGNIAIADSVRLQRQYEHHATVDSLTGLRNRRWFDDTLEKQLRRDSLNKTSTGLIILDIDNFKVVNDRYGHIAGDQVLSAIGAIINNSIRPVDQSARYGGEEFAIILPSTPAPEATQVAERLRLNMEKHEFRIENIPDIVKLTVSLGVAASTPNESPRSLVFRSDNSLYEAKEAGRNQTFTDDKSS